MNNRGFRFATTLLALTMVCAAFAAAVEAPVTKRKIRLLVVSSYHREYVWSQDTQRGFCDAMLKYGYFDNQAQAGEYTRNDTVETSRVVVKKLWMDAKRKNTKADLSRAAQDVFRKAREFAPDLIFLGDDEAGEYVGKLYLDSKTPVVFWGFNDSPLKYGLVDTANRPGHNVTGVYQSGYYLETLDLLKSIAPSIKTIGILADETVSGRVHVKSLQYLAANGKLPFVLADTVAVNDYETWKAQALLLQKKVDAFYVVSLAGLKRSNGEAVSIKEAIGWYRASITIPEATRGHYVKEGLLAAADDPGYKQSYEAVGIARDILERGADPAVYPTRTPSRGNLIVSRSRAAELGLTLKAEQGIEEYAD